MQIVIDIDDGMYIDMKELGFEFSITAIRSFQATLADAILNGIPLPKGHGRLIDADAFVERLEKIISDKDYYTLKTDMISVGEVLHAVVEDLNGTALYGFDNAPTIIEEDKED